MPASVVADPAHNGCSLIPSRQKKCCMKACSNKPKPMATERRQLVGNIYIILLIKETFMKLLLI